MVQVLSAFTATLLPALALSLSNEHSPVSSLTYDVVSTQTFANGDSMEIGWIKFASCNEEDMKTSTDYAYNSNYSLWNLVHLAKYAITMKLLTYNDIPGEMENSEYSVTADLCSNVVFALNKGYELSYPIHLETHQITGYSNLQQWIGTTKAKSRLSNSCFFSGHVHCTSTGWQNSYLIIRPRSLYNHRMFYHACNNPHGLHWGHYNTHYQFTQSHTYCKWDQKSDHNPGISMWIGFDIAGCGQCKRNNDLYQLERTSNCVEKLAQYVHDNLVKWKKLLQHVNEFDWARNSTDAMLMLYIEEEAKRVGESVDQLRMNIDEMLHADVSKFQTWNLNQMMAWIGQIENGRFAKYINQLSSGFQTDGIDKGEYLPKITASNLRDKPFEIMNLLDRNDLVSHFHTLSMHTSQEKEWDDPAYDVNPNLYRSRSRHGEL